MNKNDRLTNKEIPEAKKMLLVDQDYICSLCDKDLSKEPSKNICLDHSHVTGQIRAVLCRNCNANLGRVWHWANRSKRKMSAEDWLLRCIEYEKHHEEKPSGIYHPTYKTEQEKQILKKKRAKRRRKAKKSQKLL